MVNDKLQTLARGVQGYFDDEAKKNLQISVDAVRELLVACKQIDGSLA